MFLWNRQITIEPDSLNAGVAGLVDGVTHVNSVSDYEFSLWAPVLGTLGQFGVSARCEDFGPFADEMAERGASDDAFRAKMEAMGSWIAENPQDTLWNVLHVAGEMGDVPNVCAVVRWQAAPHQIMSAIQFGIGMADYASGISGSTTTVSASNYGYPNGICLITAYDSVSDFQKASLAVNADGGFAELLAASESVGRPETIESALIRRIL